jgi:hypothetical protein
MDVVRQAVEIAKDHGVPSGVGAHDLRVVVACEKHNIPNDFYIKTFHHHNYPTGPKPHELQRPYQEIPGYWCKDPEETIEVMMLAGMFDFEIAEDVMIVNEALANLPNRTRPWCS